MSVTYSVQFSSSVVSDSLRPYGPQHANASLSITNLQSFLKLMFIELVMPSNHLILCHSLLLLSSIFSSIMVFSNESVIRDRWPKYWSFSLFSPKANFHVWMDSWLTQNYKSEAEFSVLKVICLFLISFKKSRIH